MSFNGQIYNHRELRSDLGGLGVRFRTSGDTEVLRYVLIQWGVEGLSRLKGQFAVALWDSASRELLLARDRFGIVPLFSWSAALLIHVLAERLPQVTPGQALSR
jgi:asparagine synthase (glutamine-hydrolysing)